MAKKKSTKTDPSSGLRSEQREAAIEEYEKGIRLLQQSDYAKAIPRFEAVLESFSGEVALCDRARTYLAIARKKEEGREPLRSTRKPEESFEVGVFLLNEGESREAIRHLERAVEHEPKDADVRLALAAARVQAGENEAALADVETAVQLDDTARYRARATSDFASLHSDERWQRVVGTR